MNEKLATVDWNDLRVKSWQLLLVLSAAYTATNPRLQWAAPVFTAAAGLSQSPATAGVTGGGRAS